MKIPTIAKAGAVLTAAALLLTGCSNGGNSEGGEEGGSNSGPQTAVMYTSNNETTVGVVTDAGASLDPALRIDVVTGSSGPLLQRIQSESSSPVADVFYSAPSSTLEAYADIIEAYESPEASALPAELLDPENRWVRTNTHVVAFMANTDQIDDGTAPSSWKELLDPKWAGKIIIADPTASSTAFTALYGAYKLLGEADFEKLAANLEVTENSGNVYPAVAQGEYAVAIGYESNIYPYIAGGQPGVEMPYPTDGTFVEHDAAILIKGSPNPDGGKLLIDTILSKEAQEQNLAQSFRRPVRTDIDPTQFVDFLKLEDLKVVDIHGDDDEQGREDFLAFWQGL